MQKSLLLKLYSKEEKAEHIIKRVVDVELIFWLSMKNIEHVCKLVEKRKRKEYE